jgi:hypothetical protein
VTKMLAMGQLGDTEFTICKFVTKVYIWSNFIYQISLFLFSELRCRTRFCSSSDGQCAQPNTISV